MRRRPPDALMQFRRALAELEHLADDRDAPRRAGARQHLERLPGRGRVRVVAVVDHRDAARQPHDLAAVRRRPQLRGSRRHARQRHAELLGHRGRGEDVRQVGAAEQRRRHVHRAAPRRHARAGPLDAAIHNGARAHVGGGRLDPERHHAAAERADPRGDPRIVGVGDEQRRRAGPLEDLGLGVGDRVERGEEAEVRFADVRPHADVRLGHAHQRADLPRVIHAQFDDGHLRPLPQLDERQRQPDVVVEIPAVADHAVPHLEKFARHFLGRGLAGAAGDRHDFRSRRLPNAVRQRLQRLGRVVDFDDDRTTLG